MTKHRTKVLSFLTAFALAVGLLLGLATAEAADSVAYLEASYNEETGEVTYTSKTVEATVVEDSTTTWSDGGWYVVTGNVEISERITFNGNANLILTD